MVSRKQVFKRVLIGALNTFVVFFSAAISMGVLLLIVARFMGPRAALSALAGCAAIGLITFLLSELIVVLTSGASAEEVASYPLFPELVCEITKDWWFFVKPRLYILPHDSPNACAFGVGFLGQWGVAITPSLYHKLDRSELKAVIAHELGHGICKDVGLMSQYVVITGTTEKFAKAFWNMKTPLGKGLLSLVIGALFYLFAKVLFPIGRNTLSQEREETADALAALFVGSPRPLMSALEKIHDGFKDTDDGSFIDALFVTHPRHKDRLQALAALEQ